MAGEVGVQDWKQHPTLIDLHEKRGRDAMKRNGKRGEKWLSGLGLIEGVTC